MTVVVQFLINFLANVFALALSFQFELFGHRVSLMSVELGAIAVILFVNFFKSETPGVLRFTRHSFSKSENKKDKKNDYEPKHAKKSYVPKHGKEE